MGYTKENFLTSGYQDYIDSGDNERIASVKIAENLMEPPDQFTEAAANAWKREVEEARAGLERMLV